MDQNTTENMETPATSSYFLDETSNNSEFKQKFSRFFIKVQYYLVQIWPYVTKVLNSVFYFLITLIKSIVRIAIDQIKSFKG